MQVNLYDKKGNKTQKKVTLDEGIFNSDINEKLMSQAVFVYLSNQRQSNAQSKDRGNVRGGGKKPWRQKGTGRARHGSTRSPIWKGGGVVFGPGNERNFKKNMSKKMKQAAIRSALSQHTKDKSIFIFEDFDIKKDKKTKSIIDILKKANIKDTVLIIQGKKNTEIINAANNLKQVDTTVINELNTYSLLKYENIIILENALVIFEKFWKKT